MEDAAFVFESQGKGVSRDRAPTVSNAAPQHPSTSAAPAAPPAPAAAATAPKPAAAAGPPAEVPKIVRAFQEQVLDAKLKPFVEFTKTFAGASVVETVRAPFHSIPFRSSLLPRN
jgi:adenylyl cyclase-associated protein